MTVKHIQPTELPSPRFEYRPDPADATARVRQQALALGFDLVGIATAEPLADERTRLEEWLRRGFHGEMGWMERHHERRTDPRELFPGARSVIAVALNYYRPDQYDANPNRGKISRYAWGDDYHDVVGDKLRALLDWIRTEWPGADGKACVDIQPMMDKVWAARAGLGWIGKHTNLITTQLGSWIFLGELVLNLELTPDLETVEDHCGTCTACIDACPTGAITEPYLVDSNRCISYATIELRAPEIPAPIAGNLEGWLYGCDICQDVCPWNRFEQSSSEVRFTPRQGETSIDLEALQTMTHAEYVERFRHSAMKRAKLTGLQRNARTLKGVVRG
jgi:epoxyqueuosine reductase